MKSAELERYLTTGVEGILKGALRASLRNPKEALFVTKYVVAGKKAATLREQAEARGEHIPPFLIASITSQCNLHCAGCYSRANHACVDSEQGGQMNADQWGDIFAQAQDLGIGFILLAGGEPMMRRDVIEKAAKIPNILFPVFTNGTTIDDGYMRLFDRHRNLVPVLSIEGRKEQTDARRGDGIYDIQRKNMQRMNREHILYGASITVTTQNLTEALSPAFVDTLAGGECKALFFIEYVPVSPETRALAPQQAERDYMAHQLDVLRARYPDMLFIAFPGDERASGGCLAAGRGFFHINAFGGAEPCPFSPYSDTTLATVSLRDALHSPLFRRLREQDILMDDHPGGCVLFEKRDEVEQLLQKEQPKI